MKKLLIASLAIGLLFGVQTKLTAADTSSNPAATTEKKSKTKHRPFQGFIKAVDVKAKTITLEGKDSLKFHIISETKIKKNGKAAELKDVAVTDRIGGRAQQRTDGEWEALVINLKTRVVKPAPDKEKKATTETMPAQ